MVRTDNTFADSKPHFYLTHQHKTYYQAISHNECQRKLPALRDKFEFCL